MPQAPDRPRSSAPDYSFEAVRWAEGHVAVAGVDEAGRGCLAGPVVAAAVILLPDRDVPGLDDSKRLSSETREALVPLIRQSALSVAVGQCSPDEIDRWNILRASLEAMRRAVTALEPPASFVLVDGNRMWSQPAVPWQTIVKGDARSRSIAAASVVAKTTRDALMQTLAARHPEYGWERNKGYPTPDHFEALARFGATPHHRRSFRLRIDEPVQSDLFPQR